jgi:LuxR family maltose regulon positive regulatory protein
MLPNQAPLIATKLLIPPVRADLVARPRLLARLEDGARQPLTLVSAPPGFGKTMLVAGWLQARPDLSAAWLSLDEADDQPLVFWRYVIAALQRLQPGLGETALAMLVAPRVAESWASPKLQPQSPSAAIETCLATLINDLAALDAPLLLALDDFHLIHANAIHEQLRFLLDHQPANFHLLVLTRQDPPLGLARRRARRQLVEIRAADLRFSAAEVAEFLDSSFSLALTPTQVGALERHTEGWIVGLQMAAIILQARLASQDADLQAFFDSFAGGDRYIADYLIEEVLQRQPEPVRTFLLRTSILERFSAPLCEALLSAQGDRQVEGGGSR